MTVAYRRYENYKDSGVEWIGEVPEHWEVQNLGYRTKMIVPMRDKPTGFSGEIPWIRIEDVDGQYIEDSKTEQRVSRELIKAMSLKVYPIGTVLCTCSCSMGSTVIVKKPLTSNQTFIGIVPTRNLDSVFLYYLMNSSSERLQFISTGAIQHYLSRHDFEHLKIAFPSYEEQKKIANFLDQKTSEIDSLIADKKKLIELLLEKRQAIISEAVTKGLDKNVKMKDSGVEWIGEVPEGWKIIKLKRIVKNFESGVSVNAFDQPCGENEFGILKTSCVFENIFNPKENKVIIDEKELQNAKITPKKNCIIISRMNTPELVGASGFVLHDYDNIFLPDRLWQTIYWNKENINYLWLSYVLNSKFFRGQVTSFATGTSDSMKNISKDNYLSIIIPLPPLEEQNKIASDVESILEMIDELKNEIIEVQKKLQEYRQSLISEVVTGKIMAEPGLVRIKRMGRIKN